MDPKWARDIRDACRRSEVPFFFKQWGGTRKKRAGRELDGRTHDEMPSWGGAAVMNPEGRREAIARVDRQIAGL